ncbi:MAG: hypothetical protein U0136_07145 [Bdellovibrionota bacterium]
MKLNELLFELVKLLIAASLVLCAVWAYTAWHNERLRENFVFPPREPGPPVYVPAPTHSPFVPDLQRSDTLPDATPGQRYRVTDSPFAQPIRPSDEEPPCIARPPEYAPCE